MYYSPRKVYNVISPLYLVPTHLSMVSTLSSTLSAAYLNYYLSIKLEKLVARNMIWIAKKQQNKRHREWKPLTLFLDLTCSYNQSLFVWKGGWIPLRKNPTIIAQLYTVNHISNLLQRHPWAFTNHYALENRKHCDFSGISIFRQSIRQ